MSADVAGTHTRANSPTSPLLDLTVGGHTAFSVDPVGVQFAEPGARPVSGFSPLITINETNLATNNKHGLRGVPYTDNASSTINSNLLALDIFTPPDNGGDVSGAYIRQTGGGNALSVFNLFGERPKGFKAYCGQGFAIEAQVDGAANSTACITQCPTTSNVGGQNIASGAVSSLRDFGAVGDGVADDTDAIQCWINTLSLRRHGVIPTGVYRFTRAIKFSSSGISISGDGPYQSILSFAGKSDIGDLVTIGDGSRETSNWNLSNIRIMSSTKLTKGAAIRLRRLVRSAFSNITIDGQDGNGNLWDGIWFDSVDFVRMRGFEASSQQDAVRVNGSVGPGPKADLILNEGKIGGSGIGLHIGGAFGGLFVDNIDIIGNKRNVVIDTELAAEGNREIFFGPNTAIDTATRGCSVTLADTLAGSAAWLQFLGTWIASGTDCGLMISVGVRWIISFQGGNVFNFKEDGIVNLASDARLLINGTVIRNNSAAGVKTVQEHETLQNGIFIGNKHGNIVRTP